MVINKDVPIFPAYLVGTKSKVLLFETKITELPFSDFSSACSEPATLKKNMVTAIAISIANRFTTYVCIDTQLVQGGLKHKQVSDLRIVRRQKFDGPCQWRTLRPCSKKKRNSACSAGLVLVSSTTIPVRIAKATTPALQKTGSLPGQKLSE